MTWTHLELRSRLAELWQRVTESKSLSAAIYRLSLEALVPWTRTWAWARWLLNGFTWIQSARTITAWLVVVSMEIADWWTRVGSWVQQWVTVPATSADLFCLCNHQLVTDKSRSRVVSCIGLPSKFKPSSFILNIDIWNNRPLYLHEQPLHITIVVVAYTFFLLQKQK